MIRLKNITLKLFKNKAPNCQLSIANCQLVYKFLKFRYINIITLLISSITVICGMLLTFVTFAQDATNEVGMADTMRASGKIYVVVAVLVIIFIGFVVYLVMIDRKVSKLEKEITNDRG